VAQYKKLRPIGPLARRTNADDSVDIVDSEGNIVVSGTIDGGVSQSEFDALSSTVTTQGTTLSSLGVTVSGHTTSIAALTTSLNSLTTTVSTQGTTLSALVTQEAADVADLQAQIDAIEISTPGAITGLVAGGATPNAATFESFGGPSELGGTIIADDGVRSEVPASGDYLVERTVNWDAQISMEWSGRGAVVLIPGTRIQGLTPGTFNSGTRTGGFAPGSVIRMVRRSPNVNKQAYEPILSGVNIDGTGQKASGTFTCDNAGVFTSASHGRQDGDIIFFDTLVDGTALPSPLTNGDASKYTDSYKVSNSTGSTFKVKSWNTTTGDYNTSTVTTVVGTGIWATNVAGVRIPKNSAGGDLTLGSAAMDPDQDFDDKKEYTAGRFSNGDIVGMSGSGIISEGGSGRLAIESYRALNCRLNGFDISSNDTVLWGHWGGGGCGGFTLKKGSGTGLYAVTGNIWGKPSARSKNCGAVYLNDTAYFGFVCNQPNDWMRLDGDKNFNNAGVIACNMMHPHGENFSADSVAINVLNDGDVRLQSNLGIQGYQGTVIACNSWTRTEKNTFNTPGNFGGATNGDAGTAPTWLMTFDQNSSTPHQPAMAQIVDLVCSAPDVKAWQGEISSVSFTIGANAQMTWTAHPFVSGSRFRLHSTGTLPGGLTGDTQDYFVTTVIDANTVNFSTTKGGANVTTSGAAGSGHKGYHVGSSPYYVTGNSAVGGYYFDSYRGAHCFWSKNGTAPKVMIGLPYTGAQAMPWEGDPNYMIEMGDPTPHSGLPNRNAAYGRWEFGKSIGYRSDALDARSHSSGTFADTVKAGVRTMTIALTTTAFTAGTITLPSGVDIDASQALRVVVTGKSVAALTWAFTQVGGAWKSGTPANVPGSGMTVDLWYEKTTDTWELKTPAFSDGNLIGRIDNVAQPAGVVGESMVSKVNTGSAVSLTSTTVANITSITLTPGEWDVGANVIAVTNTASATQVTRLAAVLSTTSNSNFTSTDSTQYSIHSSATTSVSASGTDVDSLTLGKTRILVAAGTTQQVWLNVKATFTGGISAWGALSARRAT